jgi:hypothetical protein
MLEPEQLLEFAPVAFVGTITDSVPFVIPDGGSSHALTFEVDTVLAGQVPAEVEVVTANSSAGCGIDAALGTRWAIFAAEENGYLTSSLCSATDPNTAINALGPGTAPAPVATERETGSFDWQAAWLGLGGVALVAGIWLVNRRRPV